MSKYNRHQSVVSRNTDEHISEDHWLKQFENNLQKGAVQPKSQRSLFDQINTVMNGTSSKYTSVQNAVDDMMQRSGLTNYLKTSEKEVPKTKTASEDYFQLGLKVGQEDLKNHGFGSDIIAGIRALISPIPVTTEAWTQYAKGYMQGCKMPEEYRAHEMKRIHSYLQKHSNDQNNDFDKTIPVEQKQDDSNIPDIVKERPAILQTLENYIRSTRGNLPVPAIIDKLRSIHHNDISEDKMWEDDKLIRLVSRLNLEAKKDNPASYENYNNLAAGDRDSAESDLDPSNIDAFHALLPAKNF